MMTKAEEHDHLAYWTVLLNWNIFSANSSSVELFLYQTAVYLHLNEVTNTSNQQLLVLCHWLLIHHLQHTAQDGYLKHICQNHCSLQYNVVRDRTCSYFWGIFIVSFSILLSKHLRLTLVWPNPHSTSVFLKGMHQPWLERVSRVTQNEGSILCSIYIHAWHG